MIEEVLREPEETRRRIYVLYSGGEHAGQVRPVLPLRWIVQPTKIQVCCYRDEANPIEKTYFVARMVKVSYESFQP